MKKSLKYTKIASIFYILLTIAFYALCFEYITNTEVLVFCTVFTFVTIWKEYMNYLNMKESLELIDWMIDETKSLM